MSSSQHLPGWARGLQREFRSSLANLVGALPLTSASLSVRLHPQGSLVTLAAFDVREDTLEPAEDLPVGDAAVPWLETHRRELVLDVRTEHEHSSFYRPFIRRGLRSVIILPVFREETLAGTVTVASRLRTAYTVGHLRLVKMMLDELAGRFVRPEAAPARPQADRDESPRRRASVKIRGPVPMPEKPVASDEALIEADSVGRIARWNGAAEDLFGFERSEVLGNFLTLFYRSKTRHLLDPTLLDELLRSGTFRGRALCYDSEGMPVTCEVELARLSTPTGVHGFRGRFRQVQPPELLPREKIHFGFAKLYAFTNPVG